MSDQELLVRFTLLVRRVSDCLTELNSLKAVIENRLLETTPKPSGDLVSKETPKNEVVLTYPPAGPQATQAPQKPRDFQAWLKAVGFKDGHQFLHRKTETPLTLEWGVKKKEAFLLNTELGIRESSLSGVVSKVAKACGISGGNGWNRQLMAADSSGKMALIEDDCWGVRWNGEYGVWEKVGRPLKPKVLEVVESENEAEPDKSMNPLLQLKNARQRLIHLEQQYNRLDGSDTRETQKLEAAIDATEKEIAQLDQKRRDAKCGECHIPLSQGADHRWCVLNGYNGNVREWEGGCY